MNSVRQFYIDKIETLSKEINHLNRHGRMVIVLELLSVALAIVCVVAYFSWDGGIASLVIAFALIAAYVFILRKDSRKTTLADEKTRIRNVYKKELSYHDGDFSCFASGEQYIDANHPFTYDLDVFGPHSLFQRINRTITSGGSDFLAHELADTRLRTIANIKARQEAIDELAEHEELRTRFLANASEKAIDTAKILEILHDVKSANIPKFSLSLISLISVYSSISVLYVLIVLACLGVIDFKLPTSWAVLQCFIVYQLCCRPLKNISKAIHKIHGQLSLYIDLIMLIADSGLKSKEAKGVINLLSNGQIDAIQSFGQLHNILNSLDMRNEAWVFISNTFFCGDYFIVRNYLKWQERYMMSIEAWIEAVSHFDALVSMATFRYNEPQATVAELTDIDGIVFEAKGIYHPFLGNKAIRNDFTIDNQNYYIVTGANMAGKSTFLRSLGINYVLATCGMPVFANSLRISIFSLFSSMRTSDDLAHGISYFNAELLRLQQLIQTCLHNKQTLIILDEILKGTNSLDKLNGSRLFLEAVASLPVTGIIATHDLELSKMQQDYPDRFHNFCFEIQLSDEITYTYKISEGVARNQNATHLLKVVLKNIAI